VNRLSKFDLFYFSILLFAFITPFSQFIGVRLLIALAIFSFLLNNDNRIFRFFKNSWDIIIYQSVLAIGLIYSEDINTGWRVMETSFSLIALSIVFSAINLDKKQFHGIILSFVLGLLVACFICLISASVSYLQNHQPDSFFFYQFTEVINLQPTYFAYYLCFAISFMLYSLYYDELGINIQVTASIVLFLFAILMLTAGRTAYISMLLVFSFFILKIFSDETSNPNKKLSSGLAVLLLLAMLTVNYFDLNISPGGTSSNNDYWERMTLWESAIVANPDFLLGVGTGDYKTVLNDYFNAHHLTEYATESLNSHNQFIHSFFSNGLFGLFSLILLLSRPLYLSVRSQNVLGILVFFSFLIYGVTEVFLGRYQGVVFFAFLHQLFIPYYHTLRFAPSLKPS
jgi:O-antigen ligase